MTEVVKGFCCIRNKEYTLVDTEEDNVFYFYRNDKRKINLIREIGEAAQNAKELYELYVANLLGELLYGRIYLNITETIDKGIYLVRVKKEKR